MNGGQEKPYPIAWHQHCNYLLRWIMETWAKSMPIVDLGCGHNYYCNVLRYYGWEAQGFDFTPFDGNAMFCDLTQTLDLADRSNVISLEVGEHIESRYEDIYLDNVSKHGGDIILSWAIPGQAGEGHINCRPNIWVIAQMKDRGYSIDMGLTTSMRQAVSESHCNWFRETLMYFKK